MSNGGYLDRASTSTSVTAPGKWSLKNSYHQQRAGTWPTANGIVTDSLVFNIDAGNTSSYPGSGTTWTDLAASPLTGTLTNGPTYDTDGGGSIVFDGTNDYAAFGSATKLRFTASFSYNFWIKLSSIAQTNHGVCQHQNTGSYSWYIQNNKFFFAKSGTANDSTGSMNPTTTQDVWQHWSVICTYNQHARYHLNGGLVATCPLVQTFTYSGNFNVGALLTDGFYFKGKISQVQAYSKALSVSEVKRCFDADRARYGV